jgi:hypothetical protein
VTTDIRTSRIRNLFIIKKLYWAKIEKRQADQYITSKINYQLLVKSPFAGPDNHFVTHNAVHLTPSAGFRSSILNGS